MSPTPTDQNGARLALVSQSPRRRRLIRWLARDVSLLEPVHDHEFAPTGAARLECFLEAARSKLKGVDDAGRVLVAADTVVLLDGKVLQKPRDRREAREMLSSLSGREHRVVTAVAVKHAGTVGAFGHVSTVRMHRLVPRELEDWLRGDEVLGCAGAYNIECHLASVSRDECFQNVAGLPLCHLYRFLHDRYGSILAGLTPPDEPCCRARGIDCRLGPAVIRGSDTPPAFTGFVAGDSPQG